MKFFSCPILADRVLTYFEIIVSINIRVTIAPGYNGHWVGPSGAIVIIVARHNCPLSSAAHRTYRPHYLAHIRYFLIEKITRSLAIQRSWAGQTSLCQIRLPSSDTDIVMMISSPHYRSDTGLLLRRDVCGDRSYDTQRSDMRPYQPPGHGNPGPDIRGGQWREFYRQYDMAL